MTEFVLKIDCDNAAFGDTPDSEAFGAEIARILREAANRMESGYALGPCRDVNGNTVGQFGLRSRAQRELAA